MPARPRTLTRKLIDDHRALPRGTPDRDAISRQELTPGEEIALRIDQTLTQDATGTLVMLELEAMGVERVKTELSVQYVDHNLLQEDERNADDHLFLYSACQRLGVWYSGPGNGVSHAVHMERFGRPGKTLLGADSHTCAAGSMGMLAIGAGGLDVAAAMAGVPYCVPMPEVWGVRLTGALPEWVSAKDVILELLRRHGVSGGRGRVIEFTGPGLACLAAMDRHVIANMGAELGATATVFPSDERTREFLAEQVRTEVWVPLSADEGAAYEHHDEIDLDALEPLIALPSSPGNVVPVREVAGAEIAQAYIGSSANPGFRDFAIAAAIVRGARVPPDVSLDINPTSRQLLEELIQTSYLSSLVHAGARIHQAGCNGCIGMGQAPATGRRSLRTTPRNFPGRSGAREDSVYLCSPETAAASALRGEITDPRDLDIPYPQVEWPSLPLAEADLLVPPLPPARARKVELEKGPNIVSLPELGPLPDRLRVPIALSMGDDVSTDEILPAGARVLPLRSNLPAISRFSFAGIVDDYPDRAARLGDHCVLAGDNYGQGSSREHAALAPRHLGLRLVLAKSFARIHRRNLVNWGVLPLTLRDPVLHDALAEGDVLVIEAPLAALRAGREVPMRVEGGPRMSGFHDLSAREIEILAAGAYVAWWRTRARSRADDARRDAERPAPRR